MRKIIKNNVLTLNLQPVRQVIMRNYILPIIVLIFFFGVKNPAISQSYKELHKDASGFNTAPFLQELEVAANDLKQAFPSSFGNDFKVYSCGFYVPMSTFNSYSYPQAFEDLRIKAGQQSQYYLLIGRQSDMSGLYTKFYVDIKLPQSGTFACIANDTTYYSIIKDIVSDEINTTYVACGGKPKDFWIAEKKGIEKLKYYVDKLSQCCINGNFSTSCGNCKYSFEEIATSLKAKGFLQLKNHVVTILPWQYNSSLISDYKIIASNDAGVFNFTDELDYFLSALPTPFNREAKVHYFNESNCQGYAGFSRMNNANKIYCEDIVILDFNGSITIYYYAWFDFNKNVFALKDSDQKDQLIVPAVVWLLKKVASASLAGLLDLAMQMAIEYYVSGAEDWDVAWDELDVDESSIFASSLQALLGRYDLWFDVVSGSFLGVYNYLMQNDGPTIVANGFPAIYNAQAIGAIKGVFQHYGGRFLGRMSASLSKYIGRFGGNLWGNNLLHSNNILYAYSHDYRLIFKNFVWQKAPRANIIVNNNGRIIFDEALIQNAAVKTRVDCDAGMLSTFNTFRNAAANTTEKGTAGENVIAQHFRLLGYTVRSDLHYSGNKGIDLVAYRGTWPNPSETFIIESKVVFQGRIELGVNATIPNQMTPGWVNQGLDEVIRQNPNTELENFARQLRIISQSGRAQRVVTGIDELKEEIVQLFLN